MKKSYTIEYGYIDGQLSDYRLSDYYYQIITYQNLAIWKGKARREKENIINFYDNILR